MRSPSRIATITLNAAIDQTASIPGFRAGEVNRVESEQSDAGGKGVNVASFLAHFGHDVAATGLLGRDNAALFDQLFADKGITDRFVRLPGSTRVNVKIFDRIGNAVTDINFPGLTGDADAFARVLAAAETLAGEGVDWFVLSGSLPAGLPATSWRHLTERLKALGRRVALDTSGEPLANALVAGPDLIKPNIDELSALVGQPLADEADIVDAAFRLQRGGVGLVAVSMGERGAIVVDGEQAIHAAPPAITVQSTVGAGDAMVAGLVRGALIGLGLADRARLATAVSLGALGQIGPRLPSSADIDAFSQRVEVRPIPHPKT